MQISPKKYLNKPGKSDTKGHPFLASYPCEMDALCPSPNLQISERALLSLLMAS